MTSCGDFLCGVPPAQACFVNQPGCDCGRDANFAAGQGCIPDARCQLLANCSTHSLWTLGNQASPVMTPGRECVACHVATSGEPTLIYTVAGTVMGALHDPDDCNGIGSVEVNLAGNGGNLTLITNAAGNFFTRTAITPPYVPTLNLAGRRTTGGMHNDTGNCGTCHTVDGTQGAVGRLVAP
jgi:hypothetical protein